MTSTISRAKILTAGVLSLLLMVGIARFAYTPLLPMMQQYAKLGIVEGGWLAAINYAGYLSGAILASFISDLQFKDKLYRVGLIVAVLSTLMMGLTENFWIWAFSRYIAGLSSAAGILLGSGLILNWLMCNGHRSELGIHFSGMGLGILLPTLAIIYMGDAISWDQQWLFLGVGGVFILIPAWCWLPPPQKVAFGPSGHMVDAPPSKRFLAIFMVAYFCAGYGYVVSTTFIVAIVNQLPSLSGMGNWSFVVLGLAASPACILWDLIARKLGDFNALSLAYIFQIIGIIIPLVIETPAMILFGAALFGGTFIGIVSLVLTMAGRYYPTRPAKMMGKMTLSYGSAQIVAPAITAILANYTGHYSEGLYLAAAILAVGAVLILWLRQLEKKEANDVA